VRNRKKEQKLKDQIVVLRNKEREVQAQLKQKYIDLYIAMGFTVDQAVKLV
jgi:hypothetical protein